MCKELKKKKKKTRAAMEIWPAPWDRGIKIKTSMKKLDSASPYVVAFIYFSQLYFLAGHERQK